MKALTVRQPWAELIIEGRKSLELRTFNTKHRGMLALHSGLKHPTPDQCERFNIDSKDLDYGCVIGIVEITGVTELDELTYNKLFDLHLGPRAFTPPVFAWELANPHRLPDPIPYSGKLGVFEIPDAVLMQTQVMAMAVQPAEVYHMMPMPPTKTVPLHDPLRPFELRVHPRPTGSYTLSMSQWPLKTHELNGKPQEPCRVAALEGSTIMLIQDSINLALRKSGLSTTTLSTTRSNSIPLLEEPGLRLTLLFLAVAPLTRVDRIDAVAHAIRTMPHEEAYYWYSKCTAPETALRAQRALRVLLAEE